jgi:ferredoxin
MKWEEFLNKTLAKYDAWQAEGKLTSTSKVIPVGESFNAKQWVMPSEQVLHFLRNARSFALADCMCRTLARHCDKPLETCFYLNDVADKRVEQGRARLVSLDEAKECIKQANQNGLVPMTISDPMQDVFAICQCCPCCCHDLQFLMQRGRKELVLTSNYVAMQGRDACLHCGQCVERCYFGARVMVQDLMQYDPAKCYGCGLCVTTCPAEAIRLYLRQPLGRVQASATNSGPPA